MKVKNASFFQMHIEKIILALGVLFLLVAVAVVVFGVALKPYEVTVGNRTFSEPAEVVPHIVDDAKILEAGLGPSGREVPQGVEEDYRTPDLATDYEQMLHQPLLQAESFTPLAQGGLTHRDIDPIHPDAPAYFLPTPPMVTETRQKFGFEVLDVSEREVRQAYEAVWGESRDPADFSYVFIEGQFDMAGWIETLEGESDTLTMVPPGIWSQKLGLATVYLLREERDPVTGQWGAAAIVPMLPGYYGIQPNQEMPDGDQISLDWIDYLLANQIGIAMVDPPPLTEGEELLAPLDDPMTMFDFEALEAMEAEERAARAEEARQRREEDRARRQAERDAERSRNSGGDASRGGRDGGSTGRGGRGGRGSGRSGGGRDAQPPDRSGNDSRDRSTPGRGTQDREAPGRGNPGRGNPGPMTPGIDSRGPGMVEEAVMEEGMVRVWAIDVTAVPGTTYRYKLVAGVINPLYGVDRLDEAQRSENRHRAALLPSDEDIEQAPWVGPIELQPSSRFFVVSANDRGARVKVHQIHNGEWHEELFEVNPGDQIGGVVNGIDMQVGVTVVDIDRRTNIEGKTLWVLIYIDALGNLHERVLDDDKAASSQFDRELRQQREAEARAMELIGESDQTGPGGRSGDRDRDRNPDAQDPGRGPR
ncbi:MAG: hypothetical protein AAGA29_04515 [Planctomycetota bacterium]